MCQTGITYSSTVTVLNSVGRSSVRSLKTDRPKHFLTRPDRPKTESRGPNGPKGHEKDRNCPFEPKFDHCSSKFVYFIPKLAHFNFKFAHFSSKFAYFSSDFAPILLFRPKFTQCKMSRCEMYVNPILKPRHSYFQRKSQRKCRF